jgi:cell division protease FtsH
MGAEPDYSEEIAREIDDEIRRVIEEAHDLAVNVLKEHMDQLHRVSGILIERETIDKDQFERLLAGEDEASVFPDETPEPSAEPPAAERRRRPQPKPIPRPFPGATMQPPPEGSTT